MRTRRLLLALALVAATFTLGATFSDSVPPRDLMQPEEVVKLLSGPAAKRPALVHVGFQVLYRGGHIPGSVYAGPAAKPEGLAALKKALEPLPRQKAVVLYCGCCPWNVCPNVRPAYRTARAMGFQNVKLLVIRQDLNKDWAARGFPIEKSAG
jgi:hypothetical protein